MLLPHFRYLKYVLIHKYFVFLYCLEYGLIWRGIKHDWSKFLPSEWFPYVAYFYGRKVAKHSALYITARNNNIFLKTVDQVEGEFDIAWNYHQKRNDHHWQYWLLTPDNPRPHFTAQSHDGGMTHSWIATTDYSPIGGGKIAALEWDVSTEGWKEHQVNMDAIRLLESELNYTPVALPMPDKCRKEMLADWRGAGRALGKPDTKAWYLANKDKMKLHPDTRAWVEAELDKLQERHRLNERFANLGF